MTTDDQTNVVQVSRLIHAPAEAIFGVLANPARHIEIDGSRMLRGSTSPAITKPDDVFLMNMFYEEYGDYVMSNRVTEFERNRRLGWAPGRYDVVDDPWFQEWSFTLEPRDDTTTLVTERYDCRRMPEEGLSAVQHGRTWIRSMEKTLELLESVVAARQ